MTILFFSVVVFVTKGLHMYQFISLLRVLYQQANHQRYSTLARGAK